MEHPLYQPISSKQIFYNFKWLYFHRHILLSIYKNIYCATDYFKILRTNEILAIGRRSIDVVLLLQLLLLANK